MLTPDAKTRCQDQMLALDANTGREDDEATQHNKTKQNKTKQNKQTHYKSSLVALNLGDALQHLLLAFLVLGCHAGLEGLHI